MRAHEGTFSILERKSFLLIGGQQGCADPAVKGHWSCGSYWCGYGLKRDISCQQKSTKLYENVLLPTGSVTCNVEDASMGCACVISERHRERSRELPLVVSRLVHFHSAGEGPQQRPTAHGHDAI